MKRIKILILSLLAVISCNEEPIPVGVESVTLNVSVLTLHVGESVRLIATVLPSDADNKNVIWMTSNESVARVVDGNVTGIQRGDAVISVVTEDGNITATCQVVVENPLVEVTGISLSHTNVTISLGDELTLDAMISPDDATNKDVVWESDDDSIVAVNDGCIKGIAVGETVVRVRTKEGNHEAECVVSVEEISEFPITLTIEEVTATTVTFNVSLNVDLMSDYTEVGFIYSEREELDVELESCTYIKVTESSYSEIISNLPFDTDFYYAVYMVKNGVSIYGDVLSFRTSLPKAYNLSETSTANSYVVSEAGYYKFKAVKGNSDELVGDESEIHPVGEIFSAEVLWKSFGSDVCPEDDDLIKDDKVEYKDGYVYFLTSGQYQEGNVVIAVKDALDNILWSWHIWLTDQPENQTYYVYDYDAESFTSEVAGVMMDRNLGATSSTKGDVGALGLLYQWGRKDPFLGSSSISESTEAASTIEWPSSVESQSETGTIEYAVSHPTTYIVYNANNKDWYYTGTSNTDNSRWTTSASEKSIYDPCPAGWRVPDGGREGIWYKSGFDDTDYSDTNEGMSFINNDLELWYPAAGCRNYNDGSLRSVGNSGIYWSATPDGYDAYYLEFDNGGDVYPSNSYLYRAFGFSVRCLQE